MEGGCVMRRWCHRAVAVLLLTGVISPGAGHPAAAQRADTGIEVRTLSTRPDMVSGGNVLIELVLPAGANTDRVSVLVNGQERAADFKRAQRGHASLGFVANLPPGT